MSAEPRWTVAAQARWAEVERWGKRKAEVGEKMGKVLGEQTWQQTQQQQPRTQLKIMPPAPQGPVVSTMSTLPSRAIIVSPLFTAKTEPELGWMSYRR